MREILCPVYMRDDHSSPFLSYRSMNLYAHTEALLYIDAIVSWELNPPARIAEMINKCKEGKVLKDL